MKKVLEALAPLLVLSLGIAHCSTNATDSGSQTHWLDTCNADEDCSNGLTCECGICTETCTSDDACGNLGRSAVCVPPSSAGHMALCSANVSGSICLPSCSASCESGEACIDGACVSNGDGVGGNGGAGGRTGAGGAGDDSFTLVMDPFVVEPGGEVFMCQTFANPFGERVYIREFETHMSPGSHHLIVNDGQERPTNLGLETCTGLEAPVGPFVTQSSDDRYTYPEGIAAPLEADKSLLLISHYLNTSTEPIVPEVRVTMRRASTPTVRKAALTQALVYTEIEIPPHAAATVRSGMGEAAEDMEILWLLPHMHSRGTYFGVTVGETRDDPNPVTIYETTEWEAPTHHFDPPYILRSPNWLGYTCTWMNDTDETLVFGESAQSNEMCLIAFQYTAPVSATGTDAE